MSESIGNYRIIGDSPIGSGSSSIVYKAQKKDTGELVALKVIHAHLLYDPSNCKQFELEINAVAHFSNKYIIKILDSGLTNDNKYFIAMEYIEGGTLRETLKDQGSLPIDKAVSITHCIGKALNYIHNQTPPIIHCDVKPSNILLDKRGAILTDFGIAKLASTQSDIGGYGTPGYIPPEIWGEQRQTWARDIYALAVSFFEIVVGRRPNTGETLSQAKPEVGPFFDKFLLKAMSVTESYQKALDFVEDLEQAKEKSERINRSIAIDYDCIRDHPDCDLEEVLRDVKRILNAYPTYIKALMLRGEIYLKQEKFLEAQKDYKQAYEQVKDLCSEPGRLYLETSERIASFLWAARKFTKAVEQDKLIIQTSDKADCQDTFVQEARSRALERLGEYHYNIGSEAYASGKPKNITKALKVLRSQINLIEELDRNSNTSFLKIVLNKLLVYKQELSINQIDFQNDCGNEIIFKHYTKIDQAYQNLIDLEPEEVEQWREKRFAKLMEQIANRLECVQGAIAELDDDAMVKHYQAIRTTHCPGLRPENVPLTGSRK